MKSEFKPVADIKCERLQALERQLETHYQDFGKRVLDLAATEEQAIDSIINEIIKIKQSLALEATECAQTPKPEITQSSVHSETDQR